jgi:hypothetical protein
VTVTKIEQRINPKFLVKLRKNSGRKKEAIDAMGDVHFTKSNNEYIASEDNDYRFLRNQKRNHD